MTPRRPQAYNIQKIATKQADTPSAKATKPYAEAWADWLRAKR
jgi:hypothetical protein